MSIAPDLLPEFAQEMATTRRVLERVPGDRGPWKPHPRAFALGHLAQLVAAMPGWVTSTLEAPEFNLAGSPGYSFEPTEALLGHFDRHVAAAKAALAGTADADLAVTWSLRHGDRVLIAMPRGQAVRMHLSHLVHHRAQLGLYLRLLDVGVPSMYGPTADEPWSRD
jgi:uncharacterized damage-inducible protein DinB